MIPARNDEGMKFRARKRTVSERFEIPTERKKRADGGALCQHLSARDQAG
jgi:hypothetical protein